MRSMFTVLVVSAFVSSVAAAAAGPQSSKAPAHTAPTASVLDIMKTMTIPFSDKVFEAGGEAPKNAAAWDAVRAQALALAESGNLLTTGGRAKDRAAWLKYSRAQVEAANAAAVAAVAKDADTLSTAADALYETCANCHKVYMKK